MTMNFDNVDNFAELSLSKAMRDARLDESVRLDAVEAVREAEIARLTLLSDRLAPIFAEIPPSIDLFDVGIMPASQPRLWVDMVAFVEMGADKRTYRMFVDTRSGRVLHVETTEIEVVAKTVLDYVARRLIAREQLLSMPLPKSIYEAPVLAKAPANNTKPLDFNLQQELEASLEKIDIEPTKEQIVQEVTQNAVNSVVAFRKQVFNTLVETPVEPKSRAQEHIVFTKPEPQTGAAGYKEFLSAAKEAAREEASKSAAIRSKLQNGSSKGLMSWFK